jgi:hypothetical protein
MSLSHLASVAFESESERRPPVRGWDWMAGLADSATLVMSVILGSTRFAARRERIRT